MLYLRLCMGTLSNKCLFCTCRSALLCRQTRVRVNACLPNTEAAAMRLLLTMHQRAT